MNSYSDERKEALIRKMLPPHNVSVLQLAREEGISDATLYTWRKKAKREGLVMPANKTYSGKRSPEEKLSIVIETASLNEAQLSEYCRKKGLYVEQIQQWKAECVQGMVASSDRASTPRGHDKKRVKELEKELKRKEKALAETAALLVLRKKANAIWGENEDD